MTKYNYAQSTDCVICGKRMGPGTKHAACSKKKQQLSKLSQKDAAKVRDLYPGFFIHGKLATEGAK
jgi:hypothetical protein